MGDPFSEFRTRVMPIRCVNGCGRVVGKHQLDVEDRLDNRPEMSWGDIFDDLGIENDCCRRSLSSFTWVYDRSEFHPEYARNTPADCAVWSTMFSEPCSYTIHTRRYKDTAMQGPVFIGYGRADDFHDVEESGPDIAVPEIESDMLKEKHLAVLSMLVEDRVLRGR